MCVYIYIYILTPISSSSLAGHNVSSEQIATLHFINCDWPDLSEWTPWPSWTMCHCLHVHLYFTLRIRLRPRILRDVSVSDTRTTVQGTEISFPVGIAPTAFHCLAWHEGEVATARGEDCVWFLMFKLHLKGYRLLHWLRKLYELLAYIGLITPYKTLS